VRAPALLLTAALLLTGCSSGSTPQGKEPSPGTSDVTPDPRVLPTGKDDLVLAAQTYYSPTDFVPPLALAVPAGWHSTHRADDAFDLSKPDPAKDAPLVAVVFDVPEGDVVAPVLAALRARAPGAVSVTGTLLGQPATGFDVTGGSGALLSSPSGTIALDLAAGQRVRVLGTDVEGVPLLVVVLVPDATRWSTVLPEADALLAKVTRG
jgi:hypothetical protein